MNCRSLFATILCLGLLALATPLVSAADAADGPDLDRPVSLKLTDADLGRAFKAVRGMEAPAIEGQEPTVSVIARRVERTRYIDVLERAAELARTGGPSSGPAFLLDELAGFERLVVDGRNFLAEAWREEIERIPQGDPATLDYARHRLTLAERTDASTPRAGIGYFGLRMTGKASKNVDELAPEVRAAHEAWDGWGAFVSEVLPGTPAALSGLMPGDVVVRIEGFWVDSSCALRSLASRLTPGTEVAVDVLRDGQVWTEFLLVGDRGDFTNGSGSTSPMKQVGIATSQPSSVEQAR